jgi:RNA 2',3'-cyclic 3'-phosphodiesterase
MRCFIALNPPQAGRDALHAALEPLRQQDLPVRWAPADSLHLTLKFLGDIEGGEVPRIEEVLRAAADRHGPVEIELSGFGAFPSLRRANVLWAGVAPNPGLSALQQQIELACSRLGYAREQRPYRPHITVARLQSGARSPDIERAAAGFDHSARFTIDTLDLMRSHSAGGGARYEPLLRQALGRRADP